MPSPGSCCGTHHGGGTGGGGFPAALSEPVYLGTVIIQLALQLLPPDSLVLQLRLQLSHSPAKSKGDKQSVKYVQPCPGCSTWRSAFARDRGSHAESNAARLTPAALGLRSLGDRAEQQLSFLGCQRRSAPRHHEMEPSARTPSPGRAACDPAKLQLRGREKRPSSHEVIMKQRKSTKPAAFWKGQGQPSQSHLVLLHPSY